MGDRQWFRAVAPLAACGVVVAAFLPWTISGSARRNSFSTVRSARILEVAGEGAGHVVLGFWFFVPALAAAALLLWVLHRYRAAGIVAAVVGAAAVAFAAVIAAAPIGQGSGVRPTLVLGLVALVAGVATAWLARPPPA